MHTRQIAMFSYNYYIANAIPNLPPEGLGVGL
jgi:hypothetical protein